MKRARLRRNQAGFTLIEVMISILVFMVTLLGLVSLQKVSMTAAGKGREHSQAVNVARYVLTQLQMEAASWRIVEAQPDTGDIEQFRMIDTAVSGGAAGTWQTYFGDDTRMDMYMGHSEDSKYSGNVDTSPYCVYYMVEEFVDNTGTSVTPTIPEIFKATVAVVWPKYGQYDNGINWKTCLSRTTIDPTTVGRFESVQLVGILSREFASKIVE